MGSVLTQGLQDGTVPIRLSSQVLLQVDHVQDLGSSNRKDKLVVAGAATARRLSGQGGLSFLSIEIDFNASWFIEPDVAPMQVISTQDLRVQYLIRGNIPSKLSTVVDPLAALGLQEVLHFSRVPDLVEHCVLVGIHVDLHHVSWGPHQTIE
jgi:hypothetical protein